MTRWKFCFLWFDKGNAHMANNHPQCGHSVNEDLSDAVSEAYSTGMVPPWLTLLNLLTVGLVIAQTCDRTIWLQSLLSHVPFFKLNSLWATPLLMHLFALYLYCVHFVVLMGISRAPFPEEIQLQQSRAT